MRGFTLIEVLVAVAIFAVVAAIAYGGLNSIARTHGVLAEQQRNNAQLSGAIRRLEKDLEQALARPVRDPYDVPQGAFVGSSLRFSLSTLAVRTGTDGAHFRPTRVAHEFTVEGWLRSSRDVLDAAPNSVTRNRVLLRQVERVRIRYLDDQLLPSPQWPPVNSKLSPEILPRALELKFDLPGIGEITRLIPVAEPVLEQRSAP